MVEAQYRLVREHLGVKHARLVMGNSMGGMHTWIWAQKYPGFMDVAVPMASLPTEMSGRNWMLRRMLTESIRRDPAWNNGNYTTQPPSLQFASIFFATATNGGNHSYMKAGTEPHPGRHGAGGAAEGPVHRRRQRPSLPVGIVRRLQPLDRAGKDHGDAAGDQLRRRRAQPGGTRHPGARDQAGEERQGVRDPGERADAGAWDDGECEVLEAGAGGGVEVGAAVGPVSVGVCLRAHRRPTKRTPGRAG
jgi:pimeloyl-ACP methyl ester carboxylesterase